MSRQHGYISEVRDCAAQLWSLHHRILQLKAEWNAHGYSTGPTELQDGVDANAGYTKDMVGALVFATNDAIADLFSDGHASNVANLL